MSNINEINKNTQFRSGEEAVKNGRKGGIESGKTRRMQATMNKLLGMSMKTGNVANIDEIQSIFELNGVNIDAETAMLAGQLLKAIQKRDTKAAEFVRDTSGQKPTDKVEIATVDREQSLEALNKIFDEAENTCKD